MPAGRPARPGPGSDSPDSSVLAGRRGARPLPGLVPCAIMTGTSTPTSRRRRDGARKDAEGDPPGHPPGTLHGRTAGLAPGYVQANLVILPRAQAYDFLVFCQRNPRPCPLIEVTDPGTPSRPGVAAGADLRTDVPKYRIYRDGRLDAEVTDITSEWRDDFVAFLLGCSFTFESALLQSGVPVRHIEEQRIVPMFRTNLACRPGRHLPGPDGGLDAPHPRAARAARRSPSRPATRWPTAPRSTWALRRSSASPT